MDNRKLELVTDFYEFTMSNGFFSKGMSTQIAYFDIFFREIPDNRWLRCFCRFRTNYKLYKKFKFQ